MQLDRAVNGETIVMCGREFTLNVWVDVPSMKMLAPEQKTRSLADSTIRVRTSGCSNRIRRIASASSMSTPMSYEFSLSS